MTPHLLVIVMELLQDLLSTFHKNYITTANCPFWVTYNRLIIIICKGASLFYMANFAILINLPKICLRYQCDSCETTPQVK